MWHNVCFLDRAMIRPRGTLTIRRIRREDTPTEFAPSFGRAPAPPEPGEPYDDPALAATSLAPTASSLGHSRLSSPSLWSEADVPAPGLWVPSAASSSPTLFPPPLPHPSSGALAAPMAIPPAGSSPCIAAGSTPTLPYAPRSGRWGRTSGRPSLGFWLSAAVVIAVISFFVAPALIGPVTSPTAAAASE